MLYFECPSVLKVAKKKRKVLAKIRSVRKEIMPMWVITDKAATELNEL